MPSAIGVAEQQRQNRRIQRAPDEGQRAEFTRDRIPGLGHPEAEPELLDRQLRLARQLEADRRRRSRAARRAANEPGPEPEPRVVTRATTSLMTP